MKLAYLLALIPAVSLANGPHNTVKPPTDKPVSSATASATSSATSSASTGDATASTGDTSATGGESSLTYTEARQAPSVGQGSIGIVGCGAGGNVGASNTGGAAFLGIAYTPYHCQLLLAAKAYEATGHKKAACELVNLLPAVKRAQKQGFTPPSCAEPVAPVQPPVVVNVEPADTSGFVKREELIERERRQTERLTAK